MNELDEGYNNNYDENGNKNLIKKNLSSLIYKYEKDFYNNLFNCKIVYAKNKKYFFSKKVKYDNFYACSQVFNLILVKHKEFLDLKQNNNLVDDYVKLFNTELILYYLNILNHCKDRKFKEPPGPNCKYGNEFNHQNLKSLLEENIEIYKDIISYIYNINVSIERKLLEEKFKLIYFFEKNKDNTDITLFTANKLNSRDNEIRNFNEYFIEQTVNYKLNIEDINCDSDKIKNILNVKILNTGESNSSVGGSRKKTKKSSKRTKTKKTTKTKKSKKTNKTKKSKKSKK
jgi:hypothetical protein